jgi:hypothetical protein
MCLAGPEALGLFKKGYGFEERGAIQMFIREEIKVD